MNKSSYYFWLMFLIFILPPISTDSQSSSTTYEIIIQDFAFIPSELHIDIGDEVVFNWVDGATGHNVEQVNSSKKTSYESGFRSGDPQNGPTQWILPDSYVQDNITLYYICGPHVISNSMRGKIIVGTGSENMDEGGANIVVILGIFVGTGLFGFAGIVLMQKRK
ncbi:MAG: plastocyanin/azurin family copper-binding protein [Candidatus Kariarchaeaceae archaeon]